jgi:hypothetical protein
VAFFGGFTLERIDGGAGATLRVRHGGEGPPWATDARSATIDCGHHVAEEEPNQLAALLLDFLGAA